MPLKQYYKGKRILLTGTTGFLGKVLLQKFLFSLPDVDLIYVLIRDKKGSNLNQRFKKQIVSSPCFDRVRDLYKNQFDTFIENKVKPIQGDLLSQNLGLSQADNEEIINRCHVIINCAASIDFNARLDQAIDSNIRGSLRMMDLAKRTKNIQIFTHISTCYVNCNLTDLIREQIYEGSQDPEAMFANLSSMSVRELIENSESLLGKYPNTYTYTKALCQRLMKVRKGDLTLSIIRPAIINTSYKQPFPGWLDSIAAAAAYYMFAGLGIVSEVHANPNVQGGDTIPVDIVVANIIVATAYNAFNKRLSIYHVGSSDRNPIFLKNVQNLVNGFWNSNLSPSRLGKSDTIITNSRLRIKFREYKRTIPMYLYSKVSPFLGAHHAKNANKLIKAQQRATEIKKIFNFFVRGKWIYECRNFKDLSNWLTQSERQNYLLDAADIDMQYFIILNNYGIQKYILKENIQLPTPENFNLLRIRADKATYFSDIKWALTEGTNMKNRKKNYELKTKMMGSPRILAAIQQETLQRLEKTHKSFEEQNKLVIKQANDIVNQLVGQFKMPVVRFMAWTMHKVFKRIYEKVNINSQMFKVLQEIENQRKIPIVLLPTHRSYIDFLIVSYIFFLYKLKLPYIISDEALINTYLIPFLIKSSGAFFLRQQKFSSSKMYKAIFNEYVQRLLINGNNLQYFLEGARSRTGKIHTPRYEILEVLVDTLQKGLVQDICLVPLTINYEKVLEGDTFPGELLGQQKVAESLLRIIKAIPLIRSNFGRVYVQIADPIFLSAYLKQQKNKQQIAKNNGEIPEVLTKKLAYDIIYKLNEKLVIMSTGVVSAVLLMYRKGISEDMLIKTVNQISKYIARKGYKIGINQNSSAMAVRNAISYLEAMTVKTKKSIFQLQISAGHQFQKILMLSYYRNTIAHALLPQAFIGVALIAFGEQIYLKQGIQQQRLKEQTIFLMQILSLEYLHPYDFINTNQYDSMMTQLMLNSIIYKSKQNKIKVTKQQDRILLLHCSLLRPALQCYWSVVVYLLTIANNESHMVEMPSVAQFHDQVQWFIESFYEQKVVENYESCSLETIRNCLEKYESMGIISIKTISRKQARITVKVPTKKLNELETHLKNFLQNIYLRGANSPIQLARSNGINTDYLPKL